MIRITLPLRPGDALVINGAPCGVVAAAETIVVEDAAGAEIRMSADEAYALYKRGRLTYDNPLIRKLERGSPKEQKLARHARRQPSSFTDARWREAERKAWQAQRMEQLRSLSLGDFPKTRIGNEKLAAIINPEEAELNRDGVGWARENPNSSAGGLKKTGDIWRQTRSIAALGRRKKEISETRLQKIWTRFLRMILFRYHLKRRYDLSKVYREYILLAIAVYIKRYGDFSYPSEETVRRFVRKTWSKRTIVKYRGTVAELEQLTPVEKIRRALGLLEQIEVDSTPLKSFRYRQDGEIKNDLCPHITIAFDVACTVILGRYISWNHPSWEATRHALRMALWPKDEAFVRRYPNFWASGVSKICITCVTVDRGSENNNRSFEMGVGKGLGLRTLLARRQTPKAKANVERVQGDLTGGAADIICDLPEYRRWRDHVFKSKAHAMRLLPAIMRRFDEWCNDHNGRYNDGLRDVPIKRFERLAAEQVAFPPIEHKIFLGYLGKATVQREGAFLRGSTLPPFRLPTAEFHEILGRHENKRNGKFTTYDAFVDPERQKLIALFDELGNGGRGRAIFGETRAPDAVGEHSMQTWYEDGEAGRQARRKPTKEQILANHEEKLRRKAESPQIEADNAAEIEKREAAAKSYKASFVSPKARSAASPASGPAPAGAPGNTPVSSQHGPSSSTEAGSNDNARAKPRGGLFDLVKLPGRP